jgi:hypothetical protein
MSPTWDTSNFFKSLIILTSLPLMSIKIKKVNLSLFLFFDSASCCAWNQIQSFSHFNHFSLMSRLLYSTTLHVSAHIQAIIRCCIRCSWLLTRVLHFLTYIFCAFTMCIGWDSVDPQREYSN